MPKEDDPKEKDPVEKDPAEDLPGDKKGKEGEEKDDSSTEPDPLVQKLQKDLSESREAQKKNESELKAFKDKLKGIFEEEGEKKKKEKDDPTSELKQYMKEEFEKINSRLDEKEHEEVMENLASQFGLETDEQKEFFEFKVMKAQEAKGEALSEKEIKKIGEGIKKLHGEKEDKPKKGSSVTAKDGGPAVDIGDANAVTFEIFSKMNLLERSEFFRVNPQMHQQFQEKENDKALSLE